MDCAQATPSRWSRLKRSLSSRRWRSRPACMLAVAAILAVLGILLQTLLRHADSRQEVTDGPRAPAQPRSLTGRPAKPSDWGRLTPSPRPTAATAKPLGVGQTIRTGARARRRVPLPDGSVLYVNRNSQVKLDTDRQLTLSAGEVYVEATPTPVGGKGTAPFVSRAAGRQLTAVGTKFAVRVEPTGTAGVRSSFPLHWGAKPGGPQ
jgi:ferric-dicitrate binding protein FerR (iron transport regulator)